MSLWFALLTGNTSSRIMGFRTQQQTLFGLFPNVVSPLDWTWHLNLPGQWLWVSVSSTVHVPSWRTTISGHSGPNGAFTLTLQRSMVTCAELKIGGINFGCALVRALHDGRTCVVDSLRSFYVHRIWTRIHFLTLLVNLFELMHRSVSNHNRILAIPIVRIFQLGMATRLIWF